MSSRPVAVFVGHVVLLTGFFLLAWGLASIGGRIPAALTLEQPIFWGMVVGALALHPLRGIGHPAAKRAAVPQAAPAAGQCPNRG